MTATEAFDLSDNIITDVSGLHTFCKAKLIDLSGNRLRLSQLYEHMSRKHITIGTQRNVPLAGLTPPLRVGCKYDIRSEYSIGGEITDFTVIRRDGTVATKSDDYSISSDGMIVFHSPGDYQIKMTNKSIFSKATLSGNSKSTIEKRILTGTAEAFTDFMIVE